VSSKREEVPSLWKDLYIYLLSA